MRLAPSASYPSRRLALGYGIGSSGCLAMVGVYSLPGDIFKGDIDRKYTGDTGDDENMGTEVGRAAFHRLQLGIKVTPFS